MSDEIDEADLDAELEALEDDLEAVGEEDEALATGSAADAMPAYLQPCTCVPGVLVARVDGFWTSMRVCGVECAAWRQATD